MKVHQTLQSNHWPANQQSSSAPAEPSLTPPALFHAATGEQATPHPAAAHARSEHSTSGQPSSERSSAAHRPAELCDRLIPLCDGRPGLRATLQIQAQSEASDQSPPGASPLPVIDFVSSDATLDRYDEIISPVGWRLDHYRRNPVFQNAHQYGDIIFTLGKALITEVRTTPFPHLFQRIEFAVDVNPMARIAYGLYKNKFLNAVSVGFIPIRWENGDGSQRSSRELDDSSKLKTEIASSPRPSPPVEERRQAAAPVGFGASERRQDSPSDGVPARQARRTYLEQELLEVSAVGVPANPEALQLGLKSGAIERADLKDLLEMFVADADRTPSAQSVRDSIIHHPSSDIHHPSSHNRSSLTLLRLARALRDLLRRT